jgi:hypothetical protein
MRTPDGHHVLEQILAAGRGFGHREHVELAWRLLDGEGLEAARVSAEAALRRVATLHGAPERYHRTLTWAWLELVAAHRDGSATSSFESFITANPRLLERDLLSHHYSAVLLWSERARACWVLPDKAPLPAGR